MPHPTPEDLTGRVFGATEVVGPAGKNRCRITLWRVRCACGRERVVKRSDLTAGKCDVCRACAVRRNAPLHAGIVARAPRLTQAVWPGTCRRCGAAYTGTARQAYCTGCGEKGRLARAAEKRAARERRNAEMVAEAEAGRTVAEIAARHGLGANYARQLLRRLRGAD